MADKGHVTETNFSLYFRQPSCHCRSELYNNSSALGLWLCPEWCIVQAIYSLGPRKSEGPSISRSLPLSAIYKYAIKSSGFQGVPIF